MRLVLSLLLLFMAAHGQAQLTNSDQNKTVTYDEAIAAYQQLAAQSPRMKLMEFPTTDAGKPLHLLVIDKDQAFTPEKARSKNKTVFLVNNGIHPGEPCGIDASIQFAETLVKNPKSWDKVLDNVVICIIPVYNVGGSLNRGCCSRANQNGPELHGFRGNSKNLDLNRDYIKCDSKNAVAFSTIFQRWNPDVFLDTHASNGADYQYTMTLIVSQRNKMQAKLTQFLDDTMVPTLYEKMEKLGYPLAPYVHTLGATPKSGIKDYLETPRYSTGYSTLFNSFGFVSETHMWKPYAERVKSTKLLLETMTHFSADHREAILEARATANSTVAKQKSFPVAWELDTTQWVDFEFLGYEGKYKKSNITGMDRLYYDRDAPYTETIRYYNTYKPTTHVEAPKMYIIPQGYTEVIERLKLNQIAMKQLSVDTKLETEMYYIEDYQTSPSPYEFHYLHYNTKVRKEKQEVQFFAGDYVIEVNQTRNRFIVETLEPTATDSYFNWNFFDGILQQKEYFSPYVFEDLAEEILQENPELKKELEAKQKDLGFAKNQWAQLMFIYKRSKYYEPTHLRYPVARVTSDMQLQTK